MKWILIVTVLTLGPTGEPIVSEITYDEVTEQQCLAVQNNYDQDFVNSVIEALQRRADMIGEKVLAYTSQCVFGIDV